jgi:rhamnulokinase
MAGSRYLAFDLGAESGRAVIGTLLGGKLELDEKHRFPNPRGQMRGRLHWNLLQQWEELKTGLRKSAGEDLAGIGVDTWGVDFGLLDRNGEILSNPIMYRDAYTQGIMERTFATVSRDKIYELTGLQFMPFNTLFQLMALKERDSQILKSAESLLFMPDLFNYLFTGEQRNEFSIASTSQMYNPRTKNWTVDLLNRLGLPSKILGTIVPSGTVIGKLTEEVAGECGVSKEIPVIAPGCHDTASAVASVPAGEGKWCYISSGTWSLMGVELDEPVINEKTLRYNYTNEGGVGGKIRFLKNIMGMWLVQECRRQFTAEGYDHTYSELTQMAERAKPFGPLIDPDDPPFLQPGDMPARIVDFCKRTGQQPPNTRGEFVRCCLESTSSAADRRTNFSTR